MPTKEETIKEMITAMERKGWRITEQRKDLAALFAGDDVYLSPKDVYDHMKAKYPTVSLDTIYRNLRLLNEMNVLEQFHLSDTIKFKARCQTHHHHHVICVGCEKTYTFEFCPMQYVSGLPEQFNILNHKFEIFGHCADCKPE
ncbi:MAG TPA: Fur family transcriptional regulator [Bacilli bacterium]